MDTKLWEEFLQNFKSYILLDKEKGYIYIRSFLWYTDSKLPEDKYLDLEKIIREHLPKEDLMRTIAQKYKEEGIQIGKEKGKLEIATAMLQKGYAAKDIMLLTGLSFSHIHDLKKGC